MSDIFKNEFASVSDKEWRNFLTEASKPLVEAPKEASYQSQMASFAKQLAQSNLDNENAVVEANNMAIDAARQREKEAKAAEKAAKADAKELSKLGLPDISEQKPLPANWHEAKKATGYDQLPYTEQSKIYADWLDQAHVKIVTADRSKAKTAREELEARVPAPTKPKADWYDTDIIDKLNEGYNSIASSANKTLASIMPEGSIKQGLYNDAALNDIKVKAARAGMNAETLDAEKTVALRKRQQLAEYGSEDNVPFVESFKSGVADMTQGGVVQTIGNIGKSIPSSAPSLAGNAMTIAGTMMSGTGAGAVVGVPLAVAGRVVSTLGGGAATAADIGGQAWDEAYAFAKSQNKTDAEARALAEEAARQGGLYGAGIGAVEGYLGGKIGAGAIAKAGLKAGAKRIGIETAAEGVAEGAGAMAVNKILQGQGDQRSLMRGVGSASAQGAIGGAGTTVGMQAVTSAVGSKPAETAQGPIDLNTPPAVQAGVSAASAATNTVAAAAQANVEAAQSAVQAAQATGDETQVAAATAALNAATVQAQAVGEPTDAAGPSKIELIKAAAAAQDAVDAAVAKGDPVEIEAARTEFNNAVSALQADATKKIATQATNTPAPIDIDLGNPVSEPARLNGIQIRNMLDKVESIAQVRMGNTSQQSDEAKQKAKDLEPLAGAVGRKDSIMAAAKGKQQWALDIKVRGKDPLQAVANDPGLEPAQREAAQAVQEAYKTLGIPLPVHDTARYPTGNTSGYIESIGDRQKVVLSPSRASPATIIHEYTHGLTLHGLRDMELSNKPDDIAVMEGLFAIIDFIRQHPSVTNTKAGQLYAATNTKELLAEILSGRALPLTSNISVQNIIDQGGLSAGALRGLEILTNHQPTTLAQLFIKARDYILQAMGLARAVEGSVSTAMINAADIAIQRDTRRPGNVDMEQLAPGFTHLGKTAEGNFATSLSQLTNGLEQVQDGIYRTANGTLLDVNDSIAQVSDNADVQALLEAIGFDGFMTEAGEKFALGTVDAEEFALGFSENNVLIGYTKYAGVADNMTSFAARTAADIVGLTTPIPFKFVGFGKYATIARYVRGQGIEVNTDRNIPHSDYLVQAMVEETLHAVDVLNGLSVAHKSGLFDAVSDIRREASKQYFRSTEAGDFLEYGLGYKKGSAFASKELFDAELFANLGTLYFSNKDGFAQAMPIAYEFFNTVFNGNVGGRESTTGDGGVSGSVQGLAAGSGINQVGGRSQQRTVGWKSQARLGEIRNRIAEYTPSGATTINREELGLAVLTPQDKALASTIANISYTITDPATTDAQRLTYVAKFLNGTLDAKLQDAVNQTGVGLTARAAIETQAPWAQDLMTNDSGLLQTMATSASDIGAGPAEQARAVLRMYAESGQDLPKIVKIRGLIPFDNDTALGVYDPAAHRIELSDLADPGHIIHEYLHGVTQLGIDAASRSKEGKALKAVMQHMLTVMRTTAVRAGEAKPYALNNEHEMMGDLFNPAMLRVAAQTPIGTPQSKQAQTMIAELMGEKPGTMIQLLDALIRKIVSFLGVKTVPNNMTELLSRVAARATDETRKAVNDGITPNDAALRPVLSSIDMEVLPASAIPLSAAASKNQLPGRVTSATYINNIANKVNVQPLLKINRAKALAKGENGMRSEIANKISDAVHDSMGPARRWISKLPISANAVERLTNLLYLAPGKRDTLLNSAMEKHGGDAMIKALAAIKVPGITHETITQWVGHWITANHVAEKNAMLVAKRAKAHADAAQAAAAAPNNYRLMLAEAEALQAYTDQVKAVSSTNLNAGSEGHPAHAMGVAGGMNNAQAAATMAAVEQHIDTAKLKEVADHIYDMNAWRLALDIEQGKTSVESVSKFLTLTPEDAATLNDLHDARLLGNVTESMRAAARAIVRSEYVPMTGHPLSAIDATDAGLFSSGAAQPNTGKEYQMEGRTRGIADNGIATTMQGLIRSATFAGYADFTTGVGEVYDLLTKDQRTEVGLVKDNINGLTRGSDNVLLDGRTNNQIGYTIQDASILDAIRQGNVDAQDGLLAHFVQPVTRGFAYLVTQANPLFGPKNLINDMIERSLIVSTREYHTSAGAKITVGATDVVANSADALAAVNRLIRGKADYSKEADEALRDFIEQGGLSTSREAFARDAKHLVQRIKGAGAGQASPRAIRQMAAGWIEKYNKQFDMVAPLASYLALYRAGVNKTDAAGGALDLMNYRKKGAKAAGFITPMYAFAQPAFTGGANLIGMLRTRKGQMIAVTSFAAFLALQALAEAGADEDEGGNLIRQMPDYARNNNINVQVGDNVMSIPVGFGITKFMNTAARGILDYFNKGTSAFKTGQDILSQGFITSLTPFEDNDIKDPVKNIGYLLAPTVGKPFTAYIMNVRPDGGEIDREKWIDRAKHRHMQGSKKIEPEYRALAANLYDYTGWDMTPDAMKFLVKAYGVGPFKHVVANTITNPYKEAQGKDTGLPGVGSFISPVYKPLNDDAWKGQVRKAQEEMDDMRKEENKLKADTTAEGRVALRELMRKPEYRAMIEFYVKDKDLRNESAAVTRSVTSKQITKSAEEKRREAIKEKREDAEAQFLVKWRKLKGLE